MCHQHISEEHQQRISTLDGDNRIVCYTSHSNSADCWSARSNEERYMTSPVRPRVDMFIDKATCLGNVAVSSDHLFDDPVQFLAKTLRLLFNGVSGT